MEKMLVASVIIASIALAVSLVLAIVMAVYIPRVRRCADVINGILLTLSTTTAMIPEQQQREGDPDLLDIWAMKTPRLHEREEHGTEDRKTKYEGAPSAASSSSTFPVIYAPACPTAH